MFSFQIFVGSRRELVANSIHTADADATQLVTWRRKLETGSRLTTGACTPSTRLNSTVESRRRRRCVLGFRQIYRKAKLMVKLIEDF